MFYYIIMKTLLYKLVPFIRSLWYWHQVSFVAGQLVWKLQSSEETTWKKLGSKDFSTQGHFLHHYAMLFQSNFVKCQLMPQLAFLLSFSITV